MNEAWLKALILGCTFGAVLLAVEVLVSWLATNRASGKAINLRLRMIAEGRDREKTMALLRRRESALPSNLPPFLLHLGQKFERVLIASQITIPTGRLMLMILLAPVLIFVIVALLMLVLGLGLGFGQVVMVGTFAVALGFFLPLVYIQFRANRTRRKMEQQFPVALDVFVRGLRAGHPIASALDLLTVEMPDPIGSEFGIDVDEMTYGFSAPEALANMESTRGDRFACMRDVGRQLFVEIQRGSFDRPMVEAVGNCNILPGEHDRLAEGSQRRLSILRRRGRKILLPFRPSKRR